MLQKRLLPKQQLRQQRQLLKLLKQQPAVEARFAYSRKMLKKAEKRMLKGSTPALAAVDMQNIIKGIAYKTGLSVKSFQVLTVDESEETEE